MIARSKCAMRSNLERPSPSRPGSAPRADLVVLHGPDPANLVVLHGATTAAAAASPAACDTPPRVPFPQAPSPSPLTRTARRLRPGPRHGCVRRGTATPRASAPAADAPRTFDLEAHRGGAGLTVESTLAAFGHALDLGVTTLELDTQITRDGRAVVTHDPTVDGRKCRDTAPATPGDPAYPYVGKHVNTLRLAQVRTLDCGSRTLPSFPRQKASPGARMPLLSEVFALARSRSADSVRFNIETKISADAPSETASAKQFVRVLAADIRAAGVGDRVSIESFDWGSLMLMKKVSPDLPLVALTDRKNLEVGRPGASPWLGGIDIDDFGGDVVRAASSFGAEAVSPVHGSPSEQHGGRPVVPPVCHRRHGPQRPPAGDQGDPVDGGRRGHDAGDDRRRRRRPHHELPRPAAPGPAGARAAAADPVRRPLTVAPNRQVRRRATPCRLAEVQGGQRWVRSRRSATCGDIEGSRPRPIAR